MPLGSTWIRPRVDESWHKGPGSFLELIQQSCGQTSFFLGWSWGFYQVSQLFWGSRRHGAKMHPLLCGSPAFRYRKNHLWLMGWRLLNILMWHVFSLLSSTCSSLSSFPSFFPIYFPISIPSIMRLCFLFSFLFSSPFASLYSTAHPSGFSICWM